MIVYNCKLSCGKGVKIVHILFVIGGLAGAIRSIDGLLDSSEKVWEIAKRRLGKFF